MITNWHGLLIVALLVVVPVAGKLLGFSDEVIIMVTGAMVTLATASGFINTADQSSLVKTANDLTKQVNAGIANVKQDVTDLHTISTANVASIHTAVAVVAAKIAAPAPAPLVVPVEIEPIREVASVKKKEMVTSHEL